MGRRGRRRKKEGRGGERKGKEKRLGKRRESKEKTEGRGLNGQQPAREDWREAGRRKRECRGGKERD